MKTKPLSSPIYGKVAITLGVLAILGYIASTTLESQVILLVAVGAGLVGFVFGCASANTKIGVVGMFINIFALLVIVPLALISLGLLRPFNSLSL